MHLVEFQATRNERSKLNYNVQMLHFAYWFEDNHFHCIFEMFL